MELDATYMVVIARKLQIHKHVQGINNNGTNIFRGILGRTFMVQEECYKDQERVCLGIQLLKIIHSLMMSLPWRHKEEIISVLLDFTVLKQYVLHVVL